MLARSIIKAIALDQSNSGPNSIINVNSIKVNMYKYVSNYLSAMYLDVVSNINLNYTMIISTSLPPPSTVFQNQYFIYQGKIYINNIPAPNVIIWSNNKFYVTDNNGYLINLYGSYIYYDYIHHNYILISVSSPATNVSDGNIYTNINLTNETVLIVSNFINKVLNGPNFNVKTIINTDINGIITVLKENYLTLNNYYLKGIYNEHVFISGEVFIAIDEIYVRRPDNTWSKYISTINVTQ